ncbi:MAG: OB-fold domain-containing protein [Beijerinckiaceae bacterium]|nr:OB-fold domain-containing protein [Beijerinckiaceae bacterium]
MSADPAALGRAPSRAAITLKASRQRSTGLGVFPAIPRHSPSAPGFEDITLSPEAELYSFTVIHPNPRSGEAPFVLVYADFVENVRVFGVLDLPGDIAPRIGMRLRTVADDAEAGTYRFELVEGAST